MAGHSSTRKMVTITLKSVNGQPAHIAFANADDYVASVDELSPGPLTKLAGEAKVIRVDVRDQDTVDSLDRDLQPGQLLIEDLPRFLRLQPGVDQRVGVSVAQQIDVHMP